MSLGFGLQHHRISETLPLTKTPKTGNNAERTFQRTMLIITTRQVIVQKNHNHASRNNLKGQTPAPIIRKNRPSSYTFHQTETFHIIKLQTIKTT